MKIKLINPSDYPELVDLWERAVRSTHHFLSEEDIGFYRPLVKTKYLPSLDIYAAFSHEGTVLGFMGLAPGKVEMLFVDPVHKSQGIGREFLNFALSLYPALEIEANEQNDYGVAFYKKFGFKAVGRKEFDGEGRPFPLVILRYEQQPSKTNTGKEICASQFP